MNLPLIVLAGPNGAGKSTFFEAFLAELGLPFLNADNLARETGIGAYEAAREIAAIRDELISRRIGFVTETVLSDPVGEKVGAFARSAKAGFDVHLIFIGISDAQMSVRRVRSRVAAGGHDVPKEKLLARYDRCLANLERAIRSLPRVTVYDNSRFDDPYRLIAEFRDGQLVKKGVGGATPWAEHLLPKA